MCKKKKDFKKRDSRDWERDFRVVGELDRDGWETLEDNERERETGVFEI